MWGEYCHPHFTDKETEELRKSPMSYVRLSSTKLYNLNPNPGFLTLSFPGVSPLLFVQAAAETWLVLWRASWSVTLSYLTCRKKLKGMSGPRWTGKACSLLTRRPVRVSPGDACAPHGDGIAYSIKAELSKTTDPHQAHTSSFPRTPGKSSHVAVTGHVWWSDWLPRYCLLGSFPGHWCLWVMLSCLLEDSRPITSHHWAKDNNVP